MSSTIKQNFGIWRKSAVESVVRGDTVASILELRNCNMMILSCCLCTSLEWPYMHGSMLTQNDPQREVPTQQVRCEKPRMYSCAGSLCRPENYWTTRPDWELVVLNALLSHLLNHLPRLRAPNASCSPITPCCSLSSSQSWKSIGQESTDDSEEILYTSAHAHQATQWRRTRSDWHSLLARGNIR